MRRSYPNDNSAWLIRRTDLVVCCLGDVVEEELEKILGFLVLVPNDATREALVHVQRLLAGDRVLTHDGMLQYKSASLGSSDNARKQTYFSLNRLAAHNTAALSSPREVSLLDTRVDGLEGAQESDKLGRKPLESSNLRCLYGFFRHYLVREE